MTPEQENDLRHMYEGGWSLGSIALKTGLDERTVKANALRLRLRRKGPLKERSSAKRRISDKEIMQAALDCDTQRDAARSLGMTRQGFEYRLKKITNPNPEPDYVAKHTLQESEIAKLYGGRRYKDVRATKVMRRLGDTLVEMTRVSL